MIRLLLVLLLLLNISCGDNNSTSKQTYFGGEIVNPTADYVVLFKNDQIIDSAEIDDKNHFAFKLDAIEEGLYHFDHTPELQYVYLENGDSILIRLNTVDFDESLVFSGQGSDVNNFLIEMFLDFEEERPLIYRYYKLGPDEFSVKVDSLRNHKISLLKELENESTLSEKASKMALAMINYNSFIYKEKYPFYHKKRTGEENIHLTDGFYDYREQIDRNNVELAYFKPYYDFMLYHLGNVTYMTCKKECGMKMNQQEDLLHFNRHKLKLVDSLVKKDELRNILFRNIAMNYLLKEHHSNSESEKFIDEFSKLSKNESHIDEIKNLYAGIKNLQPDSELPDMMVKDTAGNKILLEQIAKGQKTVFYFWTGVQKMHYKKINQRVAHLKEKHPDYNFVGINIRTSDEQWMQLMKRNGADLANQYKCDDFVKLQRAFIIDGLDKCVIAKDDQVINGFANLFSSF